MPDKIEGMQLEPGNYLVSGWLESCDPEYAYVVAKDFDDAIAQFKKLLALHYEGLGPEDFEAACVPFVVRMSGPPVLLHTRDEVVERPQPFVLYH